MPREKPWLKMWEEWLEDSKMDSLSLAEQGAWWRLVTFCHRIGADGALVKDNGAPLTIKEILKSLKITEPPEIEVFSQMVDKMLSLDSLHWNTNTLVVTNYAKRQSRSPSDIPEAIRDRVRRFREKQKATVTGERVTPLTTPLRREDIKNLDIESSVTVTAEKPLQIPLHPRSEIDNGTPVTGLPVTGGQLLQGTPATHLLFEKLGAKRWRNTQQKESFEATEREVGLEVMKEAIVWFLNGGRGLSQLQSLLTRAKNIKKNGGKHDRAESSRVTGARPAEDFHPSRPW